MNIDASYIIYKDTENTYAINGSTGNIDFISKDAGKVINNAIMSTAGGKIFVKKGNYNIKAPINITKSAVILEGESYGSVQGINEIGTTFTFWNDIELIRLTKVDNTLLEGIILKNFRILFTGSKRTKNIIYAKDISYSSFENIYVNSGGASYDIFRLDAIDQFCVSNKFIGILIRQAGTGACISMQASTGKFITVNHFSGCRFWNAGIGVDIRNEIGKIGGVDHNAFIDCIFEGTIFYGVKDNGIGNKFIGSVFMDTSSGHTYGGQTNSRDAVIIGCTGLENASKVENLGFATIRHNPGYKTESNVLSNSFAIDSIGVKIITIPHGLSIIPNIQDCCLTIVEDPIYKIDDWSYNLLKVISTDITNVIAKINVMIASSTVGTKAKLGLRVG